MCNLVAQSVYNLRAYAKLNLFLHVVGKGNEFHKIESLFGFLDLHDEISISQNKSQNIVSFSGNQCESIPPDENSITLFFKLLKIHTGIDDTFSVHVHKNIPIAAGLGGGSVDAAAIILFFQEIYGFDDSCALAIAKGIGTDTVSCVMAKWSPSFVCGYGDVVSKADIVSSKWVVVVNPRVHISARDAYSLYRRPFSDAIVDKVFDQNFLSHGSMNDLERFVAQEYHIISSILEVIDSSDGCIFSRMSGSGATCFGVFASEQDAISALNNAKKQGWWAEHTAIRM